MINFKMTGLLSAAFLILAACGGAKTNSPDQPNAPEAPAPKASFAAVDTARIKTASAGEEWLTYGGTYDEQRHSSLKAINPDTIGQLGVAWTYDLATSRGVEATPIVVDGVMYVTSA